MKKLFIAAAIVVVAAALAPNAGAQSTAVADETAQLFFEACSTGDMKTLVPLVDQNHELVWAAREFDGKTGLHITVMVGQYDAAKFLLQRGADPNARDNHRRTALYYAWKQPYWGFVRLIVKEGGHF